MFAEGLYFSEEKAFHVGIPVNKPSFGIDDRVHMVPMQIFSFNDISAPGTLPLPIFSMSRCHGRFVINVSVSDSSKVLNNNFSKLFWEFLCHSFVEITRAPNRTSVNACRSRTRRCRRYTVLVTG